MDYIWFIIATNMTTSNSVIPTYTNVAHGANINYIGCVDNTLPDGTGIISTNENNRHWFGSIMEPLESWQEIKHSTNSQPIAIGYGHFAIGKEIYKFGNAEPVCMARDTVVSSTQGYHITRMLKNGNILQIVCHNLGRISQYVGTSFTIHFQHFQIIDGELMQVNEAFARLKNIDALHVMFFYLKGYVVVKDGIGRHMCGISRHLLIELTKGTIVDTVFRLNCTVHTRLINNGDKLGVFTHPTFTHSEAVRWYNIDDTSSYSRLVCTLDVLEGRFVIRTVDNTK